MLDQQNKLKMSFLVVWGALALGPSPTVQAQTPITHSYVIPAGQLGAAIQKFARDSGVVISFDGAIVKGLKTSGLQGAYGFEAGLSQLLRGHSLTWVGGQGVYTIQARPESPAGGESAAAGQGARLEDVVVIGSSANKQNAVYQGASSSVYLNEQELGRFSRVSPSDILNGIAGVETGDSRNGGALDVNIRGIQGMGRVAVTVDGSQQALETYRGYGGTQNRSYISADLISEVTVEKGASTKPGGAGAIGGVVAMNTIGVKDIVKEGQNSGVRLTGNLWSNSTSVDLSQIGQNDSMASVGKMPGGFNDGHGRSGSVAVAHKGDGFDVVAAYARQRQGNYYAGKKGEDRYPQLNWVYRANEEVMNTSNSNESVLLKTTLRPTDEQTLALTYRYFDGEFGEIMGSALYRGNGERIPQWPIGSMRMNTYTANYGYVSADHSWLDVKANLWLTKAKNKQMNAGPVAPESQTSEIGTDYRWSSLNNQRWGFDFANDAVFDTRWGELTWTLGGSYLEEDIRPHNVLITQDDINNNQHVRDAKRKELSFLSQLQYKPTDKLTLEVGGRYTRFKNKDRNRMVNRTSVYSDDPYKKVWLTIKSEHGYTRAGSIAWYATEQGDYRTEDNPGERIMSGDSKDILIQAYGGPYTLAELEQRYGGKVVSYSVDRDEIEGDFLGYRYEAEEPLTYSGDEFAPFASIRYQLLPSAHVYANYKEAIRVPGLFETTLGMGAGVDPSNQNLRPERSKSWEIGAAAYRQNFLRFDDQANIKVAYFKTNIHDYIARYYTDSLKMYNSESFKVSGMELQLNYDAGGFFADLAATKYFKAQTCDKTVAAFLR